MKNIHQSTHHPARATLQLNSHEYRQNTQRWVSLGHRDIKSVGTFALYSKCSVIILGAWTFFLPKGWKLTTKKIDKINDPVGYWAYCQSFENRYLSKTILDVFECFSFQRESKRACWLRYHTKSFPLTLKTCKQAWLDEKGSGNCFKI